MRWFRDNPFFAVIILLVITIVSLGTMTEKLDTILVFCHLKTDKVLALASETARGELSRNLVRLAWRRLHWARAAAFRIGADAPQADIEAAWIKYNDAAADWDAELMINIKGLADYYPHSGKREMFELEIQNDWRQISDLLFDLHYRSPDSAQRRMLAKKVEDRLDALNRVLYQFALDQVPPR